MMKDQHLEKIYKIYVTMCMDKDYPCISFDKFSRIHESARREVLKVEKKKKHPEKISVCIQQIDDNWLYRVEIINGEAKIGFITPKQYELIFGGDTIKGV